MLWRTPWLRHRATLMALATWDALSLYLSYNAIYLARLGRWEGFSNGLAVATVTWLGTSYLIGRYSPPSNTRRNRWPTRLGETVIAASALIGVFIGHSWFYQVVDAQTRFRGFLIPLALSGWILSTLGQLISSRFGSQKRTWILALDKSEANTIERELESEPKELQRRTLFARKGYDLKRTGQGGERQTGYAVGAVREHSEIDSASLLQLKEKGERVIPLLSWCEQELQRIPPELVHAEWLIQAEGFGLRPGSFSWRTKRFGDVVGGIILIIMTAPLLVMGGLLVWLEDRGPIFYQQLRSGLYGRPIRIWKLRSMRVDAEDAGIQWSRKGDPRITKVGRIIRATRVDELPQLFSVVKGDLSLIGPRPERPEIENKLEELIANYRIRHWIRPGLSGWAQVCYPYGASIDDSRMKLSYDLYYLKNASLLLDLLITLKTIRMVSRASGSTPS